MIIIGLISGLLGARLLFALEHTNAYVTAPLSLFALSATALDPWGGLLVGAAVAYLYGRAKDLPRGGTRMRWPRGFGIHDRHRPCHLLSAMVWFAAAGAGPSNSG